MGASDIPKLETDFQLVGSPCAHRRCGGSSRRRSRGVSQPACGRWYECLWLCHGYFAEREMCDGEHSDPEHLGAPPHTGPRPPGATTAHYGRHTNDNPDDNPAVPMIRGAGSRRECRARRRTRRATRISRPTTPSPHPSPCTPAPGSPPRGRRASSSSGGYVFSCADRTNVS